MRAVLPPERVSRASFGPQVFIELRSSPEGWYMKARIEGAPVELSRIYLGVLGSRDEAATEATGWALQPQREVKAGR
jgi:hypothetical protein